MKSKSQLINAIKTRAKGSWKRARQVEPKARGVGGLPPNIKNGVAVCRAWKLDETERGDPYFSLTGIVKEPEELRGRRATITWFINESEYSSIEDNLSTLANDLGLLYSDVMPEDIEGVCEVLQHLVERGVHFLFNTGRPRKENRPPNVYIQGIADGWDDDPSSNEGNEYEEPNEPEGEPEDEEEPGIDAESGQEEDAFAPSVGEKYGYSPNGKRRLVGEVVSINKAKRLVDLKTRSGDVHRNIPWDSLETS